MGKLKDSGSDRFVRFAIEDFGTAEVPIDLRRKARLEAARLGITPREALDQIRARTAARKELRQKRRGAAVRAGRAADLPTAGKRQPKVLSGSEPQVPKQVGSIRLNAKAASMGHVELSSKRGLEIGAGGRCFACRKDHRIVWRYLAVGLGRIDLCKRCKAEALDRCFGKIDALDLPHEGGQFESNRRRH